MSTPLSNYRSNMVEAADLIGDVEFWWHAEVDADDPSKVTVIYTEGITWHAETHCPEVADADGDVRAEVPDLLRTELLRLLGRDDDLMVTVSDQDEPAVEVSIGLTVEPATVERLSDLVWPFIATLTNVFDPGTFGAEYVMGNVARTLSEQDN